MELLTLITHEIWLITNWLTNNKEVVGVLLAGSGIVTISLEPVKRWLELQSHTLITVFHYLFALMAVGAHYLATSSSSNPVILFAQALIVLGTNQFLYPLITKPLAGLFDDAKSQANVVKAAAEAKQLANAFEG